MLEIGKLYRCEEYYLILFPDQKAAAGDPAPCAASGHPPEAGAVAAYWSKRLGKPVGYTEKNVPFLVLSREEAPLPLRSREEAYIEVLAGDRKGWIILGDWLNLKEID